MSEFRTVEFIADYLKPNIKTVGKFHEWGLELWEQESGDVTFTVGIIELMDGSIVTTTPDCITFID